LLITATGPGYVAENKTSISQASKNLIALSDIKNLPWEKKESRSGNAVSDTSTPLYGPSLQQTALLRDSNISRLPVPQSGSQPIVFASNRDGTDQIYLMNADGTNQTRPTNNTANDDAPRWSYNNAKIVFQSDRDNPFSGTAEIYSMNADGSGQSRLTTDPNDDSAPIWSPDGSKIAFQSFRNGVNYQIYVMNADGSGQVNVSNSGANDTQPSWSPDGLKIAFASDRDHAGYPSVYVMNANGSGQMRLTLDNAPYSDQQPGWSPDGSHIAFTSTRDSVTESWQETDDDGNYFTKSKLDVNKEIYLMYSDGSGQTRLTNVFENDDSPAWSTGGAQIVFRSERQRDNFDPTSQVWIMNGDGSGQLNLSGNGFGDYAPSWQQSGNPPPPPTPSPSPSPTGSSPVGVHWLVTDQLGTPRMIFDESGSLANVSRHDLLPFGEELPGGPANAPGPGGRLITQGYSANDGLRQHFTRKERDNETGLDYFGARYFASNQGRFTSPDPLMIHDDRLEEPQRLNLYEYCRNNPLRFIDPDGLDDITYD
jgi:RHS repeat-associated protein